MAATYLGGMTLAEAVPGLTQALSTAGSALDQLHKTTSSVDEALGLIGSTIQGSANEVDSVKNDLTGSRLAKAQQLVDTTQAHLATLTDLLDAGPMLAKLVTDLGGLLLYLQETNPTDWLQNNIASTVAAVDGFQGDVDSLHSQLQELTSVSAVVSQQLTQLGILRGALAQAIAAAIGGLSAYYSMMSALTAAGVHMFWYSGDLGSLGGSLDAATPGSGLSPSTAVNGPVLIVDAGHGTALAALQAVFKHP